MAEQLSRGAVQLVAWRTRHGLTQIAAALLFPKPDQSRLCAYENGRMVPGPKMAATIEEVTGGEVKASAWSKAAPGPRKRAA